MKSLIYFIQNNVNEIIFSLMLINLIIAIILLINCIKTYTLKKKYKNLLSGMSDINIEDAILQYYNKVNEVSNNIEDVKIHINDIERHMKICTQKIGVIRYNAFDDVGSDLSFAIAVIDENDNGFILNGIYCRENSTVYCKPIVDGKSKYTLTKEEIQAFEQAKNNYDKSRKLTKVI